MTKITLATLPDATRQEVFDQVAKHLLTQNQKAVEVTNNTICMYRGANNTACAGGCLIGDDEYDPEMERKDWVTLIDNQLAPDAHESLITELQHLHDGYSPEVWCAKLERVAARFNLVFTP